MINRQKINTVQVQLKPTLEAGRIYLSALGTKLTMLRSQNTDVPLAWYEALSDNDKSKLIVFGLPHTEEKKEKQLPAKETPIRINNSVDSPSVEWPKEKIVRWIKENMPEIKLKSSFSKEQLLMLLKI